MLCCNEDIVTRFKLHHQLYSFFFNIVVYIGKEEAIKREQLDVLNTIKFKFIIRRQWRLSKLGSR